MIRISKTTQTPRAAIKDQLNSYFGPRGLGLHFVEQTCYCAYFQGGGGYVAVDITDEDNSRVVDIQSMEWEYHAKRFLTKI